MPQVQVLNDVTARYNIDSMVDGGGSGGGGSTGGIMVVKIKFDEMDIEIFDHTWQEMYDSMANGVPVLACNVGDLGAETTPVSLRQLEDEEIVYAAYLNDTEYTCTDLDDYPRLAPPPPGPLP